MSMAPLVSVLMPAFNAEKHIAQAIESILQQTYSHFELLILDDGSTDRTKEIIDQFDDGRIVRIDLTENQGLVRARNQLVKRLGSAMSSASRKAMYLPLAAATNWLRARTNP